MGLKRRFGVYTVYVQGPARLQTAPTEFGEHGAVTNRAYPFERTRVLLASV